MKRVLVAVLVVVVGLAALGPAVAQALYNCEMAELMQKGSPGYYWYSALCMAQILLTEQGWPEY